MPGSRRGPPGSVKLLFQSCGENDDLPTVKEILLKEAQERERTGSGDGHLTGGSEGKFEYAAKNDRNSAAGPRSNEGENEEKSVAVGDNYLEDYNIQNAQRDANTVTADGANKERKVSRPAKSIVIYDTDNNTDGYTRLPNKPTPKFTYPPGLGPKEKHNLAKSFRKEPGSLGKC
ncbi:MAG: hypothetical protein Q9217_006769 [Psora testacea]